MAVYGNRKGLIIIWAIIFGLALLIGGSLGWNKYKIYAKKKESQKILVLYKDKVNKKINDIRFLSTKFTYDPMFVDAEKKHDKLVTWGTPGDANTAVLQGFDLKVDKEYSSKVRMFSNDYIQLLDVTRMIETGLESSYLPEPKYIERKLKEVANLRYVLMVYDKLYNEPSVWLNDSESSKSGNTFKRSATLVSGEYQGVAYLADLEDKIVIAKIEFAAKNSNHIFHSESLSKNATDSTADLKAKEGFERAAKLDLEKNVSKSFCDKVIKQLGGNCSALM